MSINDGMLQTYPELKIKIRTGSDRGITKKEYFEDINQNLQACNVCIVSPVTELRAAITIPMTKVHGALSGLSNSHRAFLQVLARCKKVDDQTINVLIDQIRKEK